MNDMTPLQWAVLPLKKYASFRGRAPRAEYWWFYLMTIICGFITTILDRALGLQSSGGTGPLNAVVSLAFLVPTIAALVRRLHDTNRSGWWLVGPVLAGIAFFVWAIFAGMSFAGFGTPLIVAMLLFFAWAIAMFVFSVLPGTDGPNSYGPNPYAVADYEHVFA